VAISPICRALRGIIRNDWSRSSS